MKVLVKFCVDADIIECTNHIVSNLEEYQQKYGMRKFTIYLYTTQDYFETFDGVINYNKVYNYINAYNKEHIS